MKFLPFSDYELFKIFENQFPGIVTITGKGVVFNEVINPQMAQQMQPNQMQQTLYPPQQQQQQPKQSANADVYAILDFYTKIKHPEIKSRMKQWIMKTFRMPDQKTPIDPDNPPKRQQQPQQQQQQQTAKPTAPTNSAHTGMAGYGQNAAFATQSANTGVVGATNYSPITSYRQDGV